jgi:Holliday junction resolvase
VVNSSKKKGDRAELEVQGILRDLLGVPARRALGAGRRDDIGDITGVPDTVIQVSNKQARFYESIREKPLEAERQRINADVQFAATFQRLRGGSWRVVMTPEQWAAMWREAV